MAELNEPLSERELDVLSLLVKGVSNKEIAQTLFISPNTVKVHLRNIYTKLGVSSRTEAIVAAVDKKVVSLNGEVLSNDPLNAEKIEAVADTASEIVESPAEESAADELAPLPENDSKTGNLEENSAESDVEPESKRRPFYFLRVAWVWPTIAILALIVAALAVLGQRLNITPTPAAVTTPTPGALTRIGETEWFTTQPLDQPVKGAVLIGSGTNIFQFGGENSQGEVTGDGYLFDSIMRNWRPVASKSLPVTEAQGAELGGVIFVVGGRDENGNAVDEVEAYIPSEDSWRSVAGLPSKLYGGFVIQDSGSLYHLGGSNGTNVVDSAFVYDPATNGWRPLPSMPVSVAFATGGVVENVIYVIGGENEQGPIDTCQKFDIQNESWDSCASLSQPRTRAGAAVVLNKIYILGGETDAHFGELLDPQGERWQIINVPMLSEGQPTAWSNLGVANIEAKMYLVGGQFENGDLNPDIFVFAPRVYQSFLPATQSGEPTNE